MRFLNWAPVVLAGVLPEVLGQQSFDYIIVGGGTGGLTIAERLAENPSTTVAVIEAGGKYQGADLLLAQYPAGDVVNVGTKESAPVIDWGFYTTPQTGAGNRVMSYARGKCLGGSSARNFMIYQRGTIGSYQKWADAVGDQSYTWVNILPFFKKSVNFNAPNTAKRAANATALYNSAAYTPAGGPLQISYATYAQPFSSWMQGAFNEIGIPTAGDFNSGSLLGAQYCTSTIDPRTGYRDSSQTSFLSSSTGGSFSNLKVFQNTRARKILFDSNKKAIGVTIDNGLLQYDLTAKKEVIVSAGAFQSPQLLMVSGIGPKAQLTALNIPVIADRPGVGQGMQDHVFFGPSSRVKVETETKLANDLGYLAGRAIEYQTAKTGPIGSPCSDFLGWEKVPAALRSSLGTSALNDLASYPADWPELEYIVGPGYIGDWSSLFTKQPKDGYQYATILATIVAPMSRGTVTLASASTADLPIINPNYLVHPTDQKVAIAGYKRARQAFASKFMSNLVIGQEYYPGPQVQSDADILKTIQNSLQTVWHASCTCRMGLASDPNAVVDSKAKVIGVTGLRVVDASSFALLPPGHPQSTVYMLAEKIAALIKSGQ